MRPKTRLVAAFVTNAFDALNAALDAKMYEHAACQCALRRGFPQTPGYGRFVSRPALLHFGVFQLWETFTGKG